MLTEFKDLGSKSLSMVNQSVPTAEWVSWTFTNCSSYGFIDFTETNETAASIKFLDPTSGATLATASLTSGTPVANPGYSTIKVKITNTQGVLATFNGEIRIYDLSDTEAAGSNTQVMFNDSGSLAGDAGFTYNKTTDTATIGQIIDSGLTASRAVYSDGSKQLASSATTSTELGYVNGVTSSIQTQLNARANDLYGVVSKVALYTAGITQADKVIICSTGSFAITLPTAVGNSGLTKTIKNISAATTITVTPNGAETIDGAATVALSNRYDSITVISDGANWYIV